MSTPRPAKVLHWCDDRTDAEGWLVIDSLVGGVAGGGIFMHPGVTLAEVADLAATMTLKNTLQRPRFGGGKAGVRFDPASPAAEGVLRRFMTAHRDVIAHEWSTGADLYTSRATIERIAREELGLPTAFAAMAEALARHAGIPSQARAVTDRLSYPWNEHAAVDAAATGHSVAETIRLTAGHRPRVAVQGFGSVGSTTAAFLADRGIAAVAGICETDGYLLDPAGIDVAELLRLRARHGGAALAELAAAGSGRGWRWVPRGAGRSDEEFFTDFVAATRPEVLTPCAGRYTVTDAVLREFERGPAAAVVCGANNAFAADALRDEWASTGISIIPEWVSNSGAAILFAELLKTEKFDREIIESIFEAITERIEEFLSGRGPGSDPKEAAERAAQ